MQPLSLLSGLCKLALQLLALLLCLLPPSTAVQPWSLSDLQLPTAALCDNIFTVHMLLWVKLQSQWQTYTMEQSVSLLS